MAVHSDRNQECFIGHWTDESHLSGYGRLINEKGKPMEGLFDNANILATTAKPKKAKDIKSYDPN